MPKRLEIVDSLELFDARPIELGGFTLRARSAVAVGRPNFEQLRAAMQFAHAAADSAPYWWGDLLRYAETRQEWKDRLDELLETSGLARQTLLNYTSICNRVEEPERKLAPSIGHADAVAALPRPEQTKILEEARTEGWNVRELRREIRARRRRDVIEGQAVLEGMFRVVYANPPWSSISDLVKLPVAAHVATDAVLFLWVPPWMMLANPGAREVLEAWGFTYKTNGVWDGVLGKFGSYLEITHEHLVIATRGDCQPDVVNPQPKSVWTERRKAVDVNTKPAALRRQWIERLYIRGPRLELFGTEAVDGWSVFGSDPTQWGVEIEEQEQTA